ncbi:aromatic compound dioxygenase [Ascobolus immersus RN42]|uniref:Aromatic compound dioxygenase n=1 Tax=Ascobolus immersus RN42 TaxID=1160509 RepID=A0A3N4IRF5_ASCIM|nr:aromatic compound dioxygenase [Ascobolus immersus RN42]
MRTAQFLTALASLALLLPDVTLAHGSNSVETTARNNIHKRNAIRSLEKCSSKLRARDVVTRRQLRRREFVERRNAQRGGPGGPDRPGRPGRPDRPDRPDRPSRPGGPSGPGGPGSSTANPSTTAPTPTSTSKPPSATDIFDNVSCILAPEAVVGPYYVSDMLVREDISEDEPGYELLLDVQVIDINTCEPVPKAMFDFWHCNSTGAYSGYEIEGTAGLTFLRGLQESDDDGIIQVQSVFPGWYQGRATHIHVAAHLGHTITDQGTVVGGKVNHVGQIYFPEELLEKFDVAPIYSTNDITRLKNADDFLFNAALDTNADYTNEAAYSLLGETIADGVLAAITIGIDTNAEYSLDNPGFPGNGTFPGFPGFPPNGTFPGGPGGPNGPGGPRPTSSSTGAPLPTGTEAPAELP